MTRHRYLWPGLACVVLAVLLGALISHTPGERLPAIDSWWHDLLVAHRTDALIDAAAVLDTVGGGRIAVLGVPAVIAIGLLLLGRWRSALVALAAFAASGLLVQVLKHLFDRIRPEDILVVSDHGSFPSGHTANAATIAVMLWALFPRLWVALLGVLWVSTMAFSRTVLSVHWLSDTLGGTLVGAGVALIVVAAGLPWIRREQARAVQDDGAVLGE